MKLFGFLIMQVSLLITPKRHVLLQNIFFLKVNTKSGYSKIPQKCSLLQFSNQTL
jgi:hypothetical protein